MIGRRQRDEESEENTSESGKGKTLSTEEKWAKWGGRRRGRAARYWGI